MGRAELTQRINEMAAGYRPAQILFTAVDADVFSLLKEGRSAEEVAKATGWDARGTRMLLDALVALGLADKSEDRYRNTELSAACLVPGSPAYQGNIVKHNRACMAAWLRLDEALELGTAPPEHQEERSPEELRNFILGMSDIGKMSAREILEKVDLSSYDHVLDAGGGPGSYSMAFLETHPSMRATLFDRPEVIPIAREQVEKAGMSDRFDFIGGDLATDDVGGGYDLALISNIIHSFSIEGNRKLVKKLHDALDPGGLLIIKDFLVNPERTGPAFGLIFALHMFVNTAEGDTYSTAEVAEWTDEAGFEQGRLVEVAANSRLWLARKPKA